MSYGHGPDDRDEPLAEFPTPPTDFDPPTLETMRGAADVVSPWEPASLTRDAERRHYRGGPQVTDGILGVWFPFQDVMVVDNSMEVGSDTVIETALRRRGGRAVMPWVASYTDGAGWFVKVPDAHEGWTVGFGRAVVESDDTELWDFGNEVDGVSHIYAVVWACRRLGVPTDSTLSATWDDAAHRQNIEGLLERAGIEDEYDVAPMEYYDIFERPYRYLSQIGRLPEPLMERPGYDPGGRRFRK